MPEGQSGTPSRRRRLILRLRRLSDNRYYQFGWAVATSAVIVNLYFNTDRNWVSALLIFVLAVFLWINGYGSGVTQAQEELRRRLGFILSRRETSEILMKEAESIAQQAYESYSRLEGEEDE